VAVAVALVAVHREVQALEVVVLVALEQKMEFLLRVLVQQIVVVEVVEVVTTQAILLQMVVLV
jgi:hypothetical protein